MTPDLDLDAIAAALERLEAPLAPVRPLSLLGRGFRSLALEAAGGFVVRVGLSPDAAADYEREWRVAPWLASHFPGLVPKPVWRSTACAELPFGALAYRKLSGSTPAMGQDPGARFARDLGEFMAGLHSLPVFPPLLDGRGGQGEREDALAIGVPEVDAYRRMLAARPVVLPVLASRLEPRAFGRVERWWQTFSGDSKMVTSRRAVCHHDLWHGNLLVSSSARLSGVLDLAHVEVADPAHDFAAPRYFGEAIMTELISAYRSAGGRLDAADEHRAWRFWEAREFGGLAWAIEHDDQPEIDDSIAKLLRGPIFME